MGDGYVNSLLNHVRKWRDFIFDLIFPIECVSCSRDGEWLCPDCFRNIKTNNSQYCFYCRKENRFGEFCRECQEKYSLDGVWIAGYYENNSLSNAIKIFKYHFVKDLSRPLGKYLALFLRDLVNRNKFTFQGQEIGALWRQFERLKPSPLAVLDLKNCLIIPVPLHKRRLGWRGFNQSAALARELVGYFGLEMEESKLARTKHTKAQAKLSAKERMSNTKGCFVWKGEWLDKRNVIIVDDVATTGSTLNECAKVLKENGAGEVWGLVIARG